MIAFATGKGSPYGCPDDPEDPDDPDDPDDRGILMIPLSQLSTNATVLIKYGRIETRVKLPSAQGLWPSIWMLPYDSPYGGWASGGAIDLLQSRNYMDRVHGCEGSRIVVCIFSLASLVSDVCLGFVPTCPRYLCRLAPHCSATVESPN